MRQTSFGRFLGVAVILLAVLSLTLPPPSFATPSFGDRGLPTAPLIPQPSGWRDPVLLGKDSAATYSKGAFEPTLAADGFGNAIAVWTQVDAHRSSILASRYSAASGWSTPTAIGASSGNDSGPRIAMDASGNATVVWANNPNAAGAGSDTHIWANRYDAAGGWGTATQIGGAEWGLEPQVAMDPTGNAMVVWSEYDDVNWTAWTARYTVGTGWGTPELIGRAGFLSGRPQIAVDPRGNAIAVWQSSDPNPANLMARRFVVGSGWGAASAIGVPSDFAWCVPRVATDPAGNAMVVWCQFVNRWPNTDVMTNRFSIDAGWGSPTRIADAAGGVSPALVTDLAGNVIVVWSRFQGDTDYMWATHYAAGRWSNSALLGRGVNPQISLDAHGNALAVWERATVLGWLGPQTRSEISSNRYLAGVGWGNESVFPGAESNKAPSVAMTPDGSAFLVWANDRDAGSTILWTSHFDVSSGWDTPSRLDAGVSPDAFTPQIAATGQGDAMAVWSQGDGTRYAVWASRYTMNVGWDTAIRIDTGHGDALRPQLAADGQGNAIVVWEQWDGPRPTIWANRYLVGAGWGAPAPVNQSTNGGSNPQIGVSPVGNAIALWLGWEADSRDVRASRYAVGAGWSDAEEIGTQTGEASSPQVSVDDLGNAVVVWEQDPDGAGPTGSGIWSNRYAVGSGWGNATLVSPIGSEFDPRVDVGPAGDAVVVWRSFWNSTSISANRYVSASGWEDTVPLPVGNCLVLGLGSVAMDTTGNAFVVWSCEDRSPYVAPAAILGPWIVSASRYTAGVGWEAPTRLDVDMADQSPGIAVDQSGDAIAVWCRAEWSPGGAGLWAKRYIVGAGWMNTTFVYGSEGAEPPSPRPIAALSSGSGFVVWQREEGDRSTVWASEYVVSTVVPVLKIVSPAVELTNNATVTVSGTTHPGTHLTINGTPVAVDPWGTFTYTVTLSDGTHIFVITVRDNDGNTNTRTVTLTVDTRAPDLTFASPVDGLVTDAPIVDVSGTTEPDARLVVNGLVVAVEANGSFSIRLGLAPGENTITATAADAAGNIARATIRVTYANSLLAELGQMKWLAFGALATVAAVAAFLVLYTKPWRRRPGALQSNPDDIESATSTGASATERMVSLPGGTLGATSHRHAAEKRWPTQAGANGIRLIAKERILLHLLHYARYADSSEVPPELTQERIAEAAGIGQRHFAQYSRPLLEEGLLVGRSAHVRGTVQRRKVYQLSEEGRRKALEIRDRLRSVTVRIRDDAGERTVTIAEALLDARGSMSILDILRESIETGVVDIRH